jgi:uncharacterized protein involved in cysteine biosynthesis
MGMIQRFVKRMAWGARASWSGAALIRADRRLLTLSIVPTAIHIALAVVFAVVAVRIHTPLVALALDALSGSSLLDVVALVLPWVVGLLLVLPTIIAVIVVGSIVCDPLYDLLSERTEELLTGKSTLPSSVAAAVSGALREAGATLARLAVYVPVAVALTLLGFTPASPLAFILSFFWTWTFVAYEYWVRVLTRRRVGIGGRASFMQTHLVAAFGFGAVASMLSLLPFLAPLFVVSGTATVLRLEGSVPDKSFSLSTGD